MILIQKIGGGKAPTIPSSIKKDAIIFEMFGQSNCLGRAYSSELSAELSAEQQDIYIGTNNGWKNYKAGNFYLNSGQNGVELYLARMLRDYHNKPVCIIKYAIGGTILYNNASWTNGTWNIAANSLYNTMIINRNQALYNLPAIKCKGETRFTLWIQGESDSDYADYASAYKQNEFDLITQYRSVVNKPIVNALTYTTPVYASVVRNAKLENIASISNMRGIDIDGYARQDSVHINQSGFALFAADLFSIVKDY